MKYQSIKKRMILLMLLLAMIPLVILIVFSIMSLRYYAIRTSKNDMGIMSELASDYLNWEFNTYLANAISAGMNPMLSSSAVTNERKLEVVNELATKFGMQRASIITADGIGIDDNISYADRDYFQEAMKGNTCVTPPIVSRQTGQSIVVVSAPLLENERIVGCVYFVSRDGFMNDALRDIKISENCYAFMVDSTGNIAAHVDADKVYNDQEKTSIMNNLGNIYNKMRTGEAGTETITKGGKTYIVSYDPITSVSGWSLAVVAPQSDFLGTVTTIIIISVVLAAIATIITIINSIRAARRISDPIKLCADRLVLLSNGDLSSPVPEIKTNDETKLLANSAEKLVNGMNAIIGDVDYLLSEMARGNFTIRSKIGADAYVGDFRDLIEAIRKIREDLRSVLSDIDKASSEVSDASEQVSMGSEKLSQASIEQAASIEELDATIHSISDKVGETAKNCVSGRELVESTSANVETVVAEMNNLSTAMTDISTASDEIDKIIKTIEDIAFQTNILALNAAIEAARAGDAGKGFAVVADEVRNLATKSSEAAHDTTELIERTIHAVDNGNRIAEKTYESVHGVAELAEKVKNIMEEIASASDQQSEMVREATAGFDQISAAVSDNSATAEESASTAAMLKDQSATLKELVSRFTL